MEHFPHDRELLHISSKLTVMSFNILADSLAHSFPNVDGKYLDWEYRKPEIIRLIRERFPDIIVLQECDKFEELQEEFKYNYHAYFMCKQNDHSDGIAIFVRNHMQVNNVHKHSFDNSSQVALIIEISLYNKKFMLAGIHLKSSEFDSSQDKKQIHQFEKIRLCQVIDLCQKLGTYKLPYIVAGDFNEEINKPATNYMGLLAKNAYADQQHHYTTYKKRTDQVICHAIDHIYATDLFKLTAILPVQKITENSEFLPNSKYPSDHLYIYADYQF